MTHSMRISASIFALCAAASVASAEPQRRSGTHGVVGRAVERRGPPPRIISPRVVRVAPYRPYYYRPTFRVGYPYYGYPYGYYGSGYYGYPYGYRMAPPAYLYDVPGRLYGGVRIVDAPREAEVFADGYYMGVVNDFDSIFQHMNLEAGPHRIEVRAAGFAPVAFDVNVRPGETITYRARMFPLRQY